MDTHSKTKTTSTSRAAPLSAKITGPKRAPDEDYVGWIKRATKAAELKAKDAGIKCWLTQVMHMKWHWAGKLWRMEEERLAKRSTFWRDSEWWSFQLRGASAYGVRPMRARPGNILRWEDDLRKYALSQGWDNWQSKASCESFWNDHANLFAAWAWR